MSVTKTCAVCGTAFTPRTSTALYCSDECRKAIRNRRSYERYHADPETARAKVREWAHRRNGVWTPTPRVCDVCGKTFLPRCQQQLRCSPECSHEASNRLARETDRRMREKARAERQRPPKELTSQERLRIGALVGAGRVTAWDMARELRMDVADVLRMRDEWRRWRNGVADVREVRA